MALFIRWASQHGIVLQQVSPTLVLVCRDYHDIPATTREELINAIQTHIANK